MGNTSISNMTSGDNYITIRWLNTLGGYDYWTFSARHTYGYNISNVQSFSPDIFDNWDTDFINGKSDEETLSLTSNPKIVLRSGLLNQQQINAVARVRISKRIETVAGRGVVPNQSVRVDRSSFDYRTDKQKLIEFEFSITLPAIQIQTA